MIKNTEVRIGNYVEDRFDNKNIEITKISLDDFSSMLNYKKSGDHPNFYFPITLNEEWLLNFGLKKHEKYNCFLLSKEFVIDGENNCFIIYYLDDQFIEICRIKYVHQLQNLYFALTGEELEIKNK